MPFLLTAQEGDSSVNSVRVGGGGYVTGLVVHPSVAGRRVMRTDISGAFAWDATAARWRQLFSWSVTQSNLWGVDGIALDPGNPAVIYAALGKYAANSGGGVYKTSDAGVTWEQVLATPYGANTDWRWIGECLAVDPLNSQVVYAGTRTAGLQRSLDGGGTWFKISTCADGHISSPATYWSTPPVGVRGVLLDPAAVVSGRSGVVYANVPTMGIYRSTDGGDSFALIAGSPTNANRLALSAGGLIASTETGVKKWAGSSWSDITPATLSSNRFNGIAVDSTDPQKVVVVRSEYGFNNAIFRSLNGGSSWTEVSAAAGNLTRAPDVPWWPSNWFSAATSCLAFDPSLPGQLLLGDWYGVWRTPDIWASVSNWVSETSGHESTVFLSLATPPTGPPLFSGAADVTGFRHTDLNQPPATKLGAGSSLGSEVLSLDYCETSPQTLFLVTCSGHSSGNTKIMTSSDGGSNWTSRAVPSGFLNGRVAVSAADPQNIVYLASDQVPWRSLDGGQTWSSSTGAPSAALSGADIFNWRQPLVADRVQGGAFYLYSSNSLFRSIDNGTTWTKRNSVNIGVGSGTRQLAACPGKAGELWLSSGKLHRSTDGGATWTQDTSFSDTRALGFGKPATGNPYGTLFVFGQRLVTSVATWGVWRSTDLGATWVLAAPSLGAMGNEPNLLAGDRQTFGRFYIGTNGSGILVGDLLTPLQLWRRTHWSSTEDAGVAADSADPDGDGLPNLVEYALGGTPTSAESGPTTVLGTSSVGADTFLSLVFTPTRGDLSYSVEGSSDLAIWTSLNMPALTIGQSTTVFDTTALGSGAKRFLRLRVSQ